MVGKHPIFFWHLLSFTLGVVCSLFVFKLFDQTQHNQPPLNADTSMALDQEADLELESRKEETSEESLLDRKPFIMAPVSASDISTPVPQVWEAPLLSILDQTNVAFRNQGLINLAIHTAAHVPRVQAECLLHLTYGLADWDYAQFLFLIRNPNLPLSIRSKFFQESLRIRRPEFAVWLAKSVVNEPETEIANQAIQFLQDSQTSNQRLITNQ